MANQQETQSSQNNPQDNGSQGGVRSEQGIERRAGSGTSVPARYRGQTAPLGPFTLMRRFSEDMDRFFNDFFQPSLFRWSGPESVARSMVEETFWPQVEIQHEGDKFVVQADVPGLKREDINVEMRDQELCISGERRGESERRGRGYHRTERTYGSFMRTIPLPEGTKPDTVSATFENGVLRIEMDAPNPRKGRRIEVREGSPH